jgi:hypothetical protein
MGDSENVRLLTDLGWPIALLGLVALVAYAVLKLTGQL